MPEEEIWDEADETGAWMSGKEAVLRRTLKAMKISCIFMNQHNVMTEKIEAPIVYKHFPIQNMKYSILYLSICIQYYNLQICGITPRKRACVFSAAAWNQLFLVHVRRYSMYSSVKTSYYLVKC